MKQYTYRAATEADAFYVANHLREMDRKEAEALGVDPVVGTMLSFHGSDVCILGSTEGKPTLLFGCTVPVMGSTGVVWALGTPEAEKEPRGMLKEGRARIRELLELCPRLENYAFAGNPRTLAWLKRLGFAVSEPRPHGPKREPFCHIVIEKGI